MMRGNRTQVCPDRLLDRFGHSMDMKMWRVNVLMLINAVLMLVVVGIGVYAPRYRRHRVIRLLFLGASTLFLPIVSDVAATLGGDQYFLGSLFGRQVVAARCQPGIHVVLVLVWTGLVVIIGISTSSVVACDAREGRNVGPPTELLIKAGWTAYLIYMTASKSGFLKATRYLGVLLQSGNLGPQVKVMFALLTFLTILKLLFKYIAFHGAQRSVALGRSPRFIVGYMAGLREESQISTGEAAPPPPALVVHGEESGQVDRMPHGYSFNRTLMPQTDDQSQSQLVTLDSIWALEDDDVRSWSKPKDLCFSFALFKLLRCRFARYTVSEAGFMKVHRFFRAMLLRGGDYDRVFRVISAELSFLHDYYYSALPKPRNILLSLFSISYCTYLIVFISRALRHLGLRGNEQIYCLVWCPAKARRRRSDGQSLFAFATGDNEIGTYLDFGNTYFDLVPVYLVLAVLVLSEIRDIVSCIGSKWTKVSLVCKYVRSNGPGQRCPGLQKSIAFVFRHCRSKLFNCGENKMSQCSVLLVLRPWNILLLGRCILALPNQKKKIPREVKAAIFDALKKTELTSELPQQGGVKHIRPPRSPISGPGDAISACNEAGKGVANAILVWHIATNIFEVRHPPQPSPSNDAGNRIAATHLSRYCAYLVAYCPGLLPDDDEWCESLHKAVKKAAKGVPSGLRAAAAATTADAQAAYQQLVESLRADSNHAVLRVGARLGEQLVALETATAWAALACFWSEMILYLAPSENLDGHAESIAQGGELVTLLWALLAHDGVVGRLDVADDTTASVSAAVNHV